MIQPGGSACREQVKSGYVLAASSILTLVGRSYRMLSAWMVEPIGNIPPAEAEASC